MNFFQRIASGFRSIFGANKSASLASPKGRRMFPQIKRLHNYRVELQLKTLGDAILSAENPLRPDRRNLYAIYREVWRDGHLFSQMRLLRESVVAAGFQLRDSKGKENKVATDLLQRKWFIDYIRTFVDTYFWGHSLVEFGEQNKKSGEFSEITLMPREHVRPETGEILITPSDTKGIPYRDTDIGKWLMEMGGKFDLGLLQIASQDVIRKRYALGDWSRRSEKFGMPITIAKTDTSDQTEVDRRGEMLANLGSNSWAVLDENDELEFIESGNTDAYKIYLELIDYSDNSNSKVVVGQTGTSSNEAYAGTADVHKSVFEVFVASILRDLQFHVNDELIPFLIGFGYPLDGYKIQFLELEQKDKEDSKSIPTPEPQKKKLTKEFYPLGSLCCSPKKYALAKPKTLDELYQKAAKNVYDGKLKKGDLDAALWLYNVQELWKAVEKGTGKSWLKIDKEDKDYKMMQQLRESVYSFAAFKNYHNIADMVDAMTDENDVVRSFSDFKEVAQGINTIYNETWLESEYNTSIGTAQMAARWGELWAEREDFPYLQYVAINDERTREAHAALDGVTLPITDSFWNSFFPPNGWNCRCDVIALAEADEVQPESLPSTEEVPMTFRHNAGKDGDLFGEKHPYFTDVPKETKDKILKAMNKIKPKE
jgi:SPP1 gp7 family putative phage head morphogenesis protein